MSVPISFTAAVDLPDGRHISVTIDIPADHPVTRPSGDKFKSHGDLLEHTEIAQMGAAAVLQNLLRADEGRRRRDAEEAIAEMFGKAPF